MGTNDPTAALTLPAAIDWVARSDPGGWPAVMAANHALALEGRDRVAAALGVPAPVPDDLLGSMAAVPVPGLASEAALTGVGGMYGLCVSAGLPSGVIGRPTSWPPHSTSADPWPVSLPQV